MKFYKLWRGGRVAEGTTLLTWQGVKTLEGSNPSLSAMNHKLRLGSASHLKFRLRAWQFLVK